MIIRFIINGQATNYKLSQADDIQNEAKELSRIRDYLFNELAKNTGQPAERVSFVFDQVLIGLAFHNDRLT